MPSLTRRKPRLSGWRIVGGGFAALLLVAGAISAASQLSRQTETRHDTYDQVPQSIVVDLDAGDIVLYPSATGVDIATRLSWSWARPTVTQTWEGRTLRLRATCAEITIGPGCVVSLTIGVPAAVPVVGHTGIGDITADGLSGDLTASAAIGAIQVSGASGTLALRADAGDVTAVRLTSPGVDARTGTGDVTLRFAAGDAYRVQASAGTGEVNVTVRQDPASTRGVFASTDVGDIVIGYA